MPFTRGAASRVTETLRDDGADRIMETSRVWLFQGSRFRDVGIRYNYDLLRKYGIYTDIPTMVYKPLGVHHLAGLRQHCN